MFLCSLYFQAKDLFRSLETWYSIYTRHIYMWPICMKPVSCCNFYMLRLINHFVEHSLCYKLVKTTSQYYFSGQSERNVKWPKKMAIKEKEPYFNFI